MYSEPRGEHQPDESSMNKGDWLLYCSICGWQGPANTLIAEAHMHATPDGAYCVPGEARVWTVE